MGWRVLQALVVLAVIFANIYWEITPNGFVAALAGVGLAMAVTSILSKIMDWKRQRRPSSAAYRL